MMPDELKEILSRELEEIKRNKIRAGVIAVCFAVLLIFWIVDDSGGEEIILTAEPPVTKDLPVKKLPVTVERASDGVTIVLGADADALFIEDPFAIEQEPKSLPIELPPIKSEPPPLPKIPDAPILVSSLEEPPIEEPVKPAEKITLAGTAISGDVKTAMFLRGGETLFLTIGEEIGGRKISEITPDFVTFADGTRLDFQKEVE